MTEGRPQTEWLKLMLDEIRRRKAEEAAAAAEKARRENRDSGGDESADPSSGEIP